MDFRIEKEGRENGNDLNGRRFLSRRLRDEVNVFELTDCNDSLFGFNSHVER